MIRSNHLRRVLVQLREGSRPLLPDLLSRRMPPEPGLVLDLPAQLAAGTTSDPAFDILWVRQAKALRRRVPDGGYPVRWSALEASPPPRLHLQFVARLEGATVSGLLPAVVANDGRLVDPFSRVLEEPVAQHPTYSRVRLPAPTRLTGRTLFLAAPHAGNFYHWLIDTFPRLRLLEHSGLGLDAFDHVLLPGNSGAFVEDSLRSLPGLRATRHVVTDATHVACDELFCPTSMHPTFESSRWAAAFLRRTLLPQQPARTQPRLVYLSRGQVGRRRLLNEEHLWRTLLEPAGFERITLDGLPLAEQIRAVAGASALVAPHGAALTHLVFARPGAAVIELLPDALPATYYWNLAASMGHAFRYVVGRSDTTGEIGNVVDFEIAPAHLAACLEDARAAQAAARPSEPTIVPDRLPQ